MERSKKDIPMEIYDTRNRGLRLVKEPPLLRKKESFEEPFRGPELAPLIMMLLHRFVISLQKPIDHLRHRGSDYLSNLLKNRQIPWLKLGLVLLAAYVLVKKDMHFNFALKAPLSFFAPDDQDENRQANRNAKTVAISNPHAPLSASALHQQRTKKFIKEYRSLAIQGKKEYGIPASIKMAQALIESRAGTSMLARNNNNFFGMKCFSKKCAKGHCTNATDDHHKDFFRTFSSPKDSWNAHSRLLSQGRYKHLQGLGGDYKKWAVGLKKAGYATDKKYANKLINTIEKYKLYRLDQ